MFYKIVAVYDGHKRSFLMPIHSPLCKLYGTYWTNGYLFVVKTDDLSYLSDIIANAKITAKDSKIDHFQIWQCQVKEPTRRARHIICSDIRFDIQQDYTRLYRTLLSSIEIYDRCHTYILMEDTPYEALIVRGAKLVKKVFDNYESETAYMHT